MPMQSLSSFTYEMLFYAHFVGEDIALTNIDPHLLNENSIFIGDINPSLHPNVYLT